MHEKKVGIVTLLGYENYGNRLQHLALHTLLRNERLDVESITDFYVKEHYLAVETTTIKRLVKKAIPPVVLKVLISVKKKIHTTRAMRKRENSFKRFTVKYIDGCFPIYASTYTQAKEQVDRRKIDYLVAGSDQVWNPLWDNNGYYFLRFIEPERRLSFSASFGINAIPEKDHVRISEYLNDMHYISVREKQGVDIVKELTGRDADLTLDPTLLLDRIEWDKYVDDVSVELPTEYIATYFLGTVPQAVYDFAKRKNLPLIELNNEKYEELYTLDPLQFVYVIRNAKYVLTDSFHGTAFSLKYNKEFYVFKRKGLNIDMFSRIETLTNLFGLEKRIQNNDRIEEDSEIPAEKWNEINQELTRQRELSMSRFLKAIGEE